MGKQVKKESWTGLLWIRLTGAKGRMMKELGICPNHYNEIMFECGHSFANCYLKETLEMYPDLFINEQYGYWNSFTMQYILDDEVLLNILKSGHISLDYYVKRKSNMEWAKETIINQLRNYGTTNYEL